MNTRARAPSTITDPPKRRLGRSAMSVAPLGLGGAGIGNLFRKISDEHAQDVIRAALDADVELIDTAPYYGFGLSERRIGAALRAWPASRAIVSTKVGRVLEPLDGKPVEATRHGFVSSEPFEPRFDYSYDGVMRSFESSLQRLGVERVGVLLCHDLGRMTHGAEHDAQLHEFLQGGYRAMQRLRAQGAVGAIGLGVNECEICTTVLAPRRRRKRIRSSRKPRAGASTTTTTTRPTSRGRRHFWSYSKTTKLTGPPCVSWKKT